MDGEERCDYTAGLITHAVMVARGLNTFEIEGMCEAGEHREEELVRIAQQLPYGGLAEAGAVPQEPRHLLRFWFRTQKAHGLCQQHAAVRGTV